MPWRITKVEDIRAQFVKAVTDGKQSIAALCRAHGISRKTGYKWLRRSNAGKGLTDVSRAPSRVANKTDAAVEAAVVALRNRHPAWGPKKLTKRLSSSFEMPSVKTVGRILSRNGLIDPAESLKHKAFRRFERSACNDLWQADFKGDFSLGNGQRCYPFDILDDHSRFALFLEARPNVQNVKECFLSAFRAYGLPKQVLTDNGWCFRGIHNGYTALERWFMDHDVHPIHGRPYHPQTQGKVERFHLSMKLEALRGKRFTDLEEADAALGTWRDCYNRERPHEALNGLTPAEVYKPSPREYTESVKPFDYDTATHVCKVNKWGYLRFTDFNVYLSETFIGTRLAVQESKDGATFEVIYRNYRIAEIDPATGKLLNRVVSRLP